MPQSDQSPSFEAPPESDKSAGRSGYSVLAASGLVIATAFAAIATLASAQDKDASSNSYAPPAANSDSGSDPMLTDAPSASESSARDQRDGKPSEATSSTVVVTGKDGKRTTTTVPPQNGGPGNPKPPGTRPPGNPRPPDTPGPPTTSTSTSTSSPPSSSSSPPSSSETRSGSLPPSESQG